MSTTATPRDDIPSRTPLRGRLAVLSVTLGIFAVVTTEILPIGLLTPIGADFAVADGTAGLMMTMPGLLAAVAAPVVTLATARADRRLMLGAFVLLLAVADFLTAAATAYWVVLLARVLVGVTIGGFWSVGVGLAARLVPARSAGRATAVVFAAVPLGSVLGVPAGTLIGDLAGWRTAFVTMGLLSAGVLALLLLTLPALPPEQVTRPAVLRDLLREPGTGFALLTTFLVVLAHFGTYTYVTPFLREVTHAGPGTVTGFLLVYGCAGVAGNFLGGALVTRRPHATFGAAAALIALATALLPFLGRSEAGALALLVLWGLGYGAVPVCSQNWFARAATRTPEAASVLFTASFQATIAIGALAGGFVVDHATLPAVMALGAATAGLVSLAARIHFVRARSTPGARPSSGR
ncbi:MFS transporter [Streptomyces sp. A0642]|uniref:MFS transporter n=1 Tax=Streptomyces sp. A0642 TaxID=2563100 RepID=UPI0010A22374|nr:MFS transporter [Streptomyces sp. A0642]THA73886.1 MFS transporter [Streptomyces sp. A0642]